MQTLGGIRRTPGACFAYYGERDDWPIAATVHRDSELIERSNFEAMRRAFDACTNEGEDWAIERASHWAVGWVEYLLVRPCTECVTMADDMRERIEQYPILDDQLYSDMGSEEHDEGVCEYHCTMCEYEREDHRTGDCRDDCKLCAQESDDSDE
jgi:hypothetical protein